MLIKKQINISWVRKLCSLRLLDYRHLEATVQKWKEFFQMREVNQRSFYLGLKKVEIQEDNCNEM